MKAAGDMATATGSNSVVIGLSPMGVTQSCGDEELMADVHEDGKAAGDARDVTMAETADRTLPDIASDSNMRARARNN
jgi:hypothetical protein